MSSPDEKLDSLSFRNVRISLPLLRLVEFELGLRSGRSHERILVPNRISEDDIGASESGFDRFEIRVIATDEFDFESFEERFRSGGLRVASERSDGVACFGKGSRDGSAWELEFRQHSAGMDSLAATRREVHTL